MLINRELVERIVLQQLALIFSGQESPVFSHRNEQLLKEMNVKSIKNWKDWIIPENDEKMYEDEVCARVTGPQTDFKSKRLKMLWERQLQC